MKKIIIIMMAIFIILPVTNVFAQTDGLLNGKPMIRASDYNLTDGSSLTTFTDNNISTQSNLSSSGSYDTAYYKFQNPVDITDYHLNHNSTDLNQFVIKFYNSSNQVIATINAPVDSNANGIKTPYQIQGVYGVAVQNISTTTSYALWEFDVFGVLSSENINHLPVTNLTETHNHNTVNLNWTNPTETEFMGTIIKQNGVEVTQLANNTSGYSINGLTAETTYDFEVIAKYSDSINSTAQSIQVVTNAVPSDDTAPSDISSLLVENTDTTTSFIYSLPIDTDFSHLDIYRNGSLLVTGHTLSTFDDVSLVPNTSYVYKFVSVDESGNQSNGYTQTVLTDAEIDNQAPTAPTGIVTANGNGGGTVTWDSSTATDLNGYNVYVNGIKHNTTLIKATSYVVPNLSNDVNYQISVTAVDTSGNESLQSEISTITPNLSEMPIYEMKYSLKDVADGTSSWFGSIWLILAFSVAIPMTFLVARRIKDLFLA